MEYEYEERWLRIIEECISPQALDWIKRKVEREHYETARITAAIERKDKEINGA